MLDFNNVRPVERINKDFILSRITDSMIFGLYFGNFKFDAVYKSKFRKDRNPSTGFYVSKSGKLIYNDLKTGEKLDCFAFVAKLYSTGFNDTVKRIATDFGLISGVASPHAPEVMKKLANFDKEIKRKTLIHFEPEKWGVDNLKFWNDYHISKSELKLAGIYPIKKLYINETFIPNRNEVLRYALTLEHKGELLTKVYSPVGEDTLKWVSNIPLDVPFGIDKLKYSDPTLFIAKAQKDRIILKKFLPEVIATQNESLSAISDNVRRMIDFNYNDAYLGWDNDETGMTAMAEAEKSLGYIPAHLPEKWLEKYGAKDWSDLAKYKGLNGVERLLKQYKII